MGAEGGVSSGMCSFHSGSWHLLCLGDVFLELDHKAPKDMRPLTLYMMVMHFKWRKEVASGFYHKDLGENSKTQSVSGNFKMKQYVILNSEWLPMCLRLWLIMNVGRP